MGRRTIRTPDGLLTKLSAVLHVFGSAKVVTGWLRTARGVRTEVSLGEVLRAGVGTGAGGLLDGLWSSATSGNQCSGTVRCVTVVSLSSGTAIGVMLVRRSKSEASGSELTKTVTKLRIQEAAVRLFAAKGFEATGIREIADQAGVRTSALYHYMNSKEDLLVDIMLSILAQLIESANQALVGVTSPPARLVALVRAHVSFHALARLNALVGDGELRALSSEGRSKVVQRRDEYEGLWAAVVREGSATGVFDVQDLKITRLALLEMCNGVAHWYSEHGTLAVGEMAEAFAELALSLVGASDDGRKLRVEDVANASVGEVLAIVRGVLLNAPDFST
jgi:AcrR family transcriptional regulator